MSSYRGPFNELSPSDQADIMIFTRSEDVLICEWCDEQIDQIDVSVEAFEIMGGPCCVSCLQERIAMIRLTLAFSIFTAALVALLTLPGSTL